MGDNHSSGSSGDTVESLKAEREDLEKTVAGVRQMTRDFDALTEQQKLFDPKRIALHLQLKGPHMDRCVWKGILTPEPFQWHKAAIARQKALGEQVLRDLAAFAQALIGWAEDLEKRESRQLNVPSAFGLLAGPGISNEINAPGIEGEAAVDGEATDSVLTGATLLPEAAAAAVVTGAGVMGYGAYKGAVEPGLKAWSDATKVQQSQLASQNYDIDNDPDYENTPQKGLFLNPGERRWQDGTIRTSSGQIVVDANGNSLLSNEEREAIALNCSNGYIGTIRNLSLAGQKQPVTGIQFNANGFPDFSGAAIKTVQIVYTGKRDADETAANLKAGLTTTPDGYTWHHVEDGMTMQLVPTNIHMKTGHTGGFSLFPSP